MNYKNIDFRIYPDKGKGSGRILLAMIGENGEEDGNVLLFPSEKECLDNNIKVKKRLVIRVDGEVAKTINIKYIPKPT